MRCASEEGHVAERDVTRKSKKLTTNGKWRGQMTSNEKGRRLEDAVKAIEGAIIRRLPGYSESTFNIEGRKIFVVNGVRHEVDVFVASLPGTGYESRFIFECKNWSEKVGKNEIIILSEKVRALNAQRGFIVAKAFTADAIAQLALDLRVEKLDADEIDASLVEVPGKFHLVQIGESDASIIIAHWGADGSKTMPLDMDKATLRLREEESPLRLYTDRWLIGERDERMKAFNSIAAGQGDHEIEFRAFNEFAEGEAFVDGSMISHLRANMRVKAKVVPAIVRSVFDVATRGRSIVVEIATPEIRLMANFVLGPHLGATTSSNGNL